ncbi:hypothetical protein LX77_01758 [Gelidibacter algens]|uniref:Lipoprotein n=1 Tax=Gelidibacter algens TaxID=49280 RepID=A0A1A7QY36_9FLAO|nr:hypothetical protein [Gelidibacter algens]OBX24930.1 hypothetical protein A9996_12580 [Gelidibacter algens]RAJ24762.1 hypothetical protein LX77_01758 [Gelidibacter algens]
MKHVIITLGLLALVGCKDGKNEETNTTTEAAKPSVEATNEQNNDHSDEVSNVYQNAWTNEIVMNNGNKWQADAPTNEGVQKMQNTIQSQITNTLDAYHKLAEQLNDDKNNVVKNCTMQGASHDNLHIWLLPLMDKIEALSETKTVEDAAKIKQSIKENINGYNTYFK